MMTRMDFVAMAHNYADGFTRAKDYGAVAILWDNVLGFTGISKASNPRFDRERFLTAIADRMRDNGGAGLADYNRAAFQRFGRTF